MLVIIAFIIALFFAMNIGASGAAASMGIAYGSGAIKWRSGALFICAIGIFLGSAIGSAEVIKTIGSGLIPTSLLTTELVIIILVSACVALFIANILGIPLSTSEVTVGSVVGVGIAYNVIFFNHIFKIVIWWIITPIVAFALAFVASFILKKVNNVWGFPIKKNNNILMLFVIVAGFLEAFSAGMNNAANAIGPLVGAGLISIENGMLLGGAFVALGAMFLGGRVIETNGKKITKLTVGHGVTVSLTSAILVIIASIYGVPVPMTQITTSGILGVGVFEQGRKIFKRNIIKKILTIWIVSPILSIAISYTSIKILIEQDYYTFIANICIFFATIGIFTLVNIVKKEIRT